MPKARRFFIEGAPGSGKTTLAETLSGRGYIWVFDFGFTDSFSDRATVKTFYDEERNLSEANAPPTSYNDFIRDLRSSYQDGALASADWWMLDSFSGLDRASMLRHLWTEEKKGLIPEIVDYRPASEQTAQCISELSAKAIKLNKTLLVPCHVENKEYNIAADRPQPFMQVKGAIPMSGPVEGRYVPLVFGRLREYVAGFFTDCYYAKAGRDNQGKPEWILQLRTDRRHPGLKCASRTAPPELVWTIKDWSKATKRGLGEILSLT